MESDVIKMRIKRKDDRRKEIHKIEMEIEVFFTSHMTLSLSSFFEHFKKNL